MSRLSDLRKMPVGGERLAAIAVILGAIALPFFFETGSPFIDDAVLALAYVGMALGLNIIVGFAGLLDLGYVAFFAIGAYTMGWLGSNFFFGVNDGEGLHRSVDTADGRAYVYGMCFLDAAPTIFANLRTGISRFYGGGLAVPLRADEAGGADEHEHDELQADHREVGRHVGEHDAAALRVEDVPHHVDGVAHRRELREDLER